VRKKLPAALAALAPLLYLIVAVLVVAVVAVNGVYPSGADTMFHLYRGDVLYQSWGEGVLFPFYDPVWFNGVDLFRFVPPLGACVLALCQALAGGSVYNGYLLFLGLLFFISALIWLWIGARMERPLLGALAGLLWFFQPYHLHVLFEEGDLPRAIAVCVVPLLCYHISHYWQTRRWTSLPAIGVLTLILCLTHIGFAGMALLCALVAVVVRLFVLRTGRGVGTVLTALCSGVLLSGLWLVPFFTGGGMSHVNETALAASYQPLAASLDVVSHFTGGTGEVYFGLGLFLLLCFCGLFCRGAAAVQARTGFVLVLLTTVLAYNSVGILYGAEHLRPVWIFPIAACGALLALFSWRTLRRPLIVLLCVLLIADTVPSLSLMTGDGQISTPAEARAEQVLEETLLAQAKAMTQHRLAILDEGNLGCEGIFLASSGDEPVPISGGDDRALSTTQRRLTRLSWALTGGGYLYVFDRCLDMGCDTILIMTGLIPQKDLAEGKLDAAAAQVGYSLAVTNGPYRVYHIDLGEGWGVKARYPAIGIGEHAYYTSLYYPAMEETGDWNLSHYTFEELSQYKLILLTGFTYDDLDSAEQLILRLSEAGVHIVIEADGIPENEQTHSRGFLGVRCNDVIFSNGYPVMDTIDGLLNVSLFPRDHTHWETFYVEGLDEIWGTVPENGFDLPFYGTAHNENLVFIGLNLSYYYALTRDEEVGMLLSHAMALPDRLLPQREVVPLGVTYGPNSITFTTEADNVNTTLASHDFFVSDRPIYERDQFLWVGAGETTVELRYPNFSAGLGTVLLGLVILLFLSLRARGEDPARSKVPAEDVPTEDLPPEDEPSEDGLPEDEPPADGGDVPQGEEAEE